MLIMIMIVMCCWWWLMSMFVITTMMNSKIWLWGCLWQIWCWWWWWCCRWWCYWCWRCGDCFFQKTCFSWGISKVSILHGRGAFFPENIISAFLTNQCLHTSAAFSMVDSLHLKKAPAFFNLQSSCTSLAFDGIARANKGSGSNMFYSHRTCSMAIEHVLWP